jgi:ABC-2 type transport system ATP-binding protein
MIRIDQLTKNYGSFQAVKSISFEVNDGEILGFLGSNGAGKSTTLKVMTGYLSPTAGNVYVNDMNIIEHPIEIQKHIGYLPELNPLYGDMIVYDILKFIASMRGISDKNFNNALDRVVSDCTLNSVVHKKVSECSKGFKQRIGLASAMIHDPEILILDEPVSGLDPNQIIEIRELIKRIGQEKIVIMSSHILQEIQATVDRIIIINEGTIVADGSPEKLVSGAQSLSKLELEISGPTIKEARMVEGSIDGLQISDISRSKGIIKVLIEHNNKTDFRADIFKYAVNNDWILLKMNPVSENLEGIFRELTSSNHE